MQPIENLNSINDDCMTLARGAGEQ